MRSPRQAPFANALKRVQMSRYRTCETVPPSLPLPIADSSFIYIGIYPSVWISQTLPLPHQVLRNHRMQVQASGTVLSEIQNSHTPTESRDNTRCRQLRELHQPQYTVQQRLHTVGELQRKVCTSPWVARD